jgi:hypothetical protein
MINDRRYSPESVNSFVSAAKFLTACREAARAAGLESA